MVHLTDGTRAAGGSSADLWELVNEAVASSDLEGHLAVYILQSGLRDASGTAVRPAWSKLLDALNAASGKVPNAPLRNPHDVASLGVRLALGFDGSRGGEYPDLARRELARSPLPPAPCIHDNEKVLLGVAAGIGVAARTLSGDLAKLLAKPGRSVTLRQRCIDLFATTIASGRTRLDADSAQRAFHHLIAPGAGRTSNPDDYVAAFWLVSRLLDAEWQPSDAELRSIDDYLADIRRSVEHAVSNGEVRSAIDAAFVLDASAASPTNKLARRSAMGGVLAIVDAFKASADVLRKRHANRTPFEIKDEYDVQDLFFALVLPIVPDIVREDPASKVANKSSRLDFTSKSTGLGIELKHLKSKGDADRVRDEILVDEATYQAHPYVDTVAVFVHDPEGHIVMSARRSFEADLSKTISIGSRAVRHIVRVR